MTENTAPISARLSDLLAQIYPALDHDILSSQVIEAFFPDDTPRRDTPRPPGNDLWTSQDAMMITYGNSFQDGSHKPLDLLNDFLRRYMRGTINSVISCRFSRHLG